MDDGETTADEKTVKRMCSKKGKSVAGQNVRIADFTTYFTNQGR
jgi:hypothetical protein